MNITVRTIIALVAAVFCVGTQVSTKKDNQQTPASAETERAPQIKIESAMRFRTLVSRSGEEQNCVHPDSSQNSCLLLKISGVSMIDITGNQGEKETYVSAGDAQYRFSTMHGRGGMSDRTKYILLIFTVPKDLKEFDLKVGDVPPMKFKGSIAVVEKITEDELFKEPAHDKPLKKP